ncbi:hypothetical protein EAG_14401 [Camponotus floridanus]|uniref:Uncharacterized protein n=2 Tax=Camponotus floridanus TaxID=104421 RepID=E2ABP1_CAMFO|nr:hypothetical protein EAG_14401 [Camponotus floridanus]
MGSLIVVLIAVIIYCSETKCDASPITVAKSEDTIVEKNDILPIEKGIFWKNLDLFKGKLVPMEESKNLYNETNRRKSRLLGSLAFLAGLSFGGLAAASTTAKTFAKLPPTSFSLNLGSSKDSPYIAAYYNPYPLLPYPFFFPGHFGFNLAKAQATHNDLINLFGNRQPIDLREDNEEYLDEDKSKNNKKMGSEDGADDRTELRAKVDRNAEEKIRGCKESQRKQGNFLKGSIREREDLQVDADDSRATLNFQAADMNAANGNQTVTEDTTTTMTTRFIFFPTTTEIPWENKTSPNNSSYYPQHSSYYGGYPQNINHVDLTTGLNAHRDYNQINYNLPYEQPVNFYQNDKYNVYSHLNPPFPEPFSPDHVNEYAGTNINRLYHSEYQPPYYNDGFRPVT